METQFHNALLIHNPNAGNGGNARRRLIEQARRILSAGGIEAELAETTAPGHATEIAQQAIREGRQLVITCGGDGTLNEVVNGLATSMNGHRVPLALAARRHRQHSGRRSLRCHGTFRARQSNDRARIAEIALGLATPLEHHEKKRYFLSVAGAGPDGMIVYSVDLGLKARVGILALLVAGRARSSALHLSALSRACRRSPGGRHAGGCWPHEKLRRPLQNYRPGGPLSRTSLK